MISINKGSNYIRLLSDLCGVGISFFMATFFSLRGVEPLDWYLLLFLSVTWIFSSRITNLYDEFRTARFVDEFILLIPNILLQSMGIIFLLFTLNEHRYQRTFAFLFPILLFLLLTLKKYVFKVIMLELRKRGRNTKKIVILGAGSTGMSFWEMIKDNPQFGYKVVGFVDDRENATRLNGMYRGSVKELEVILDKHSVDEIIVTRPNFENDELENIMRIGDKHAIRTRIIPDYFKFTANKYKMEMFGQYPLITVRNEPLEQYHWQLLKRLLDIAFSLLVIVFVFSWLLPIIALLIKLDSKGPVLFIQDRWGKGGKRIACFKFRSMYVQKEGEKFKQATKEDARVTRIGKILRRTNIDELPQFFNVLIGTMSVVGPRPHAVAHSLQSKEAIDNYLVRHWVKPGITGWAQINGLRGETKDMSMMKKRVEYDIWYIENWTWWLDAQIVVTTVYNMVKGDLMAY